MSALLLAVGLTLLGCPQALHWGPQDPNFNETLVVSRGRRAWDGEAAGGSGRRDRASRHQRPPLCSPGQRRMVLGRDGLQPTQTPDGGQGRMAARPPHPGDPQGPAAPPAQEVSLGQVRAGRSPGVSHDPVPRPPHSLLSGLRGDVRRGEGLAAWRRTRESKVQGGRAPPVPPRGCTEKAEPCLPDRGFQGDLSPPPRVNGACVPITMMANKTKRKFQYLLESKYRLAILQPHRWRWSVAPSARPHSTPSSGLSVARSPAARTPTSRRRPQAGRGTPGAPAAVAGTCGRRRQGRARGPHPVLPSPGLGWPLGASRPAL